MKRKSFEEDACPVARSLEAVGDAWSMLIVRQAFAGERRFGEFEKSLGVAKNILTVRLRKLVALGVLEQVPVEGSAYHEYALTEKGRGLYLVLMAIRQWGEGCGGRRPVRAGGPAGPEAGQAAGVPRPRRAGAGVGDMELVPTAEFARPPERARRK